MQILPLTLSSEEITLVREIINMIIKSYTTNGKNGHPEFDDFLEEYGESFDVTMTDINFELVENIILMEELYEAPEYISRLGLLELMMMQFTLLNLIPKDKCQIGQVQLSKKLIQLIKLKSINNG